MAKEPKKNPKAQTELTDAELENIDGGFSGTFSGGGITGPATMPAPISKSSNTADPLSTWAVPNIKKKTQHRGEH
jgi:hypothetical protein|tara:strand:- start:254 stop:478 length:225 start_codon:yes stop_codon:yes gene_type:complete